jgi:hypothetical protein
MRVFTHRHMCNDITACTRGLMQHMTKLALRHSQRLPHSSPPPHRAPVHALQDICNAVEAALSLSPTQRAALGLAARAAFDRERAAFLDRVAAAEQAVEEALMVKARTSGQQQQQHR